MANFSHLFDGMQPSVFTKPRGYHYQNVEKGILLVNSIKINNDNVTNIQYETDLLLISPLDPHLAQSQIEYFKPHSLFILQ